MTVKSTDVPSAFQYYIDYNADGVGQLKKITYGGSQAAGNTNVANSNRVDFNYTIGDANSLNVDSINANTINTKTLVMPVNNDPSSPVTITAIANEDEPPSLNLDL